MALDRWFLVEIHVLSDRLVAQNGIVLMGTAGFAGDGSTGGSVKLLVVLVQYQRFYHVLSFAGGDGQALVELA